MKKLNKQDIKYEELQSGIKNLEDEQEQLGFKISSLKSMMARYVEEQRKQK